jgi:hypothetical protein
MLYSCRNDQTFLYTMNITLTTHNPAKLTIDNMSLLILRFSRHGKALTNQGGAGAQLTITTLVLKQDNPNKRDKHENLLFSMYCFTQQ